MKTSDFRCVDCTLAGEYTSGYECKCSNDGYFLNESSYCQQCDSTCEKCIGSLPTQCTSCNNSRHFHSTNNSCLLCNVDGYYIDAASNCKQCNSNCRRCTGDQPTHCTACYADFYLYSGNNTCLTCNVEGYFVDTISNECRHCDSTCRLCTGDQPTHCTACYADFYLYSGNNTCLTCNVEGYFVDTISNECRHCDSTCRLCTGDQPTECTACYTGYLMESGSNSCLTCNVDGYYIDTISGECQQCDLTCKQCTGTQPTQCTVCYNDRHLFSGNNSCLLCNVEGYYVNQNSQCIQCDPSCSTYSGTLAATCISCIPSSILSTLSSSQLQQLTTQAIGLVQGDSSNVHLLEETLSLLNEVAQVANLTDNSTLSAVLQGLNSSVAFLQNLDGTSVNLTDAVQQVADTLSTIITKVVDGDCGLSTDFSVQAINTTYELLGVLSDISLENATNDDAPQIIDTSAFVSYSALVNSGELSGMTIQASDGSPEVTLGVPQDAQNLPGLVAVNYIYMKEDPLSCNNTPSTNFTISFKDGSTFQPITVNTSVEVTYSTSAFPRGVTCTDGCISSKAANGNTKCSCPDISVFNVGSQLAAIYQQSNLHFITMDSFWRLFKEPMYKNWALWAVVGYTLWLLLTVVVVKTSNKSYNLLAKTKEERRKKGVDFKFSNCYKFYVYLCCSHPLVSIYMLADPEMSKSMRALVYYVRSMGLLCFTSIFVPASVVNN